MKHVNCIFAALALCSTALAGVPIRWAVETSRAAPAAFEQYQGTSLDLEAALTAYGRPLAIEGDARLYWQTNGMGAAYWSAPASVSGNVMRAAWTPSMDVGARDYVCFIGIPGSIYSAAFRLRLRPSPGADPNALPLPVPRIDFATVEADNAPWATLADIDGLASTNEAATIGRSVNALWQYTFGDRAWIAVTNYIRTAEGVVPSLQLWEVRDGATNCVYSSGEEIAHVVSNEVGRIALVFSNLLEGVRAQIPATAWSAYQSMSGAPNPASNEVTVVSTPSVMLTGGAEWQQYVDVSSNSLWVLSSRGVTIAGSDTNGYFRIYDAEGNAAFEVVKEKAKTVPAIPHGNMIAPGDTGTMSVTFIAKTQPILWFSPTLSPPAFVEASEDTNASVAWTDNGNGTWTVAIDFVHVQDTYFAYATYVEPGTTVVKNNAPMRVDGGIVTSDGKRIKPVVSGSSVSWEVVAE